MPKLRYAFRITRAPYADLTGEGARLAGGRWNRPGRAAVYASESRALCALESLVHMRPNRVPPDLVLLRIDIPESVSQETWTANKLPKGWTGIGDDATRDRGDAWLESAQAAVLWAPSAIVQQEMNAIINPMHPDHRNMRIAESTPFTFDPRLLPQGVGVNYMDG